MAGYCGVGERLLAVRKGDGDPLEFTERLYCRNEKSPIPGALTVRWSSTRLRFSHVTAFTRPRRDSCRDGIHTTAPGLWQRWSPRARAGFPTVLAEALARLRVDVRRRIRRCAGTSEHARSWGARRSARGCLAPRFRLHRRTERDRQRRERTAFRG